MLSQNSSPNSTPNNVPKNPIDAPLIKNMRMIMPRVAPIVRKTAMSRPLSLTSMINPEIIESSGEQTGDEGCLSVPGKAGTVTRPNYVKAKYYDLDMNECTVEGTELFARAMCHEFDHLDGHLYVEKVEGPLHEVTYEEEGADE